MASYIAPSSDVLTINWTRVPTGGTFASAVDDSVTARPQSESDFIHVTEPALGNLIFGMNWPAFWTDAFYSDGTSGVRPGLFGDATTPQDDRSVTCIARLAISGGTPPEFSPLVRRSGVDAAGPSFFHQAASNADPAGGVTHIFPNFGLYAAEWFNGDPFTNDAWTVANLLATSFGINNSGLEPGQRLYCAAFAVRVTETDAVGNTKARLGPAQGEPAYFCVICSEPHHLSKLIKVRNPEHPHYSRLVCSDCLDEITQYETRDQGIKEGDFDFEG